MHLYFGLRGIKHMRDMTITHLQTQWFPWKRKNLKTGEEETTFLQGSLRPVELYEYVFPEECLEEVLTMLKMTDENIDYHENSLGKIGKFFLNKFRSILGLEPIPRGIKREPPKHIIPLEGVTLHPIGIKKDIKKDMPEFGYYQEMI